jgi:hypothetical protein
MVSFDGCCRRDKGSGERGGRGCDRERELKGEGAVDRGKGKVKDAVDKVADKVAGK